MVALRKESVDRNVSWKLLAMLILVSLSARRAWIEIQHTLHDFPAPKVALRKESVDRNIPRGQLPAPKPVALRKESVDRNNAVQIIIVIMHASLSARRAWIEICRSSAQQYR